MDAHTNESPKARPRASVPHPPSYRVYYERQECVDNKAFICSGGARLERLQRCVDDACLLTRISERPKVRGDALPSYGGKALDPVATGGMIHEVNEIPKNVQRRLGALRPKPLALTPCCTPSRAWYRRLTPYKHHSRKDWYEPQYANVVALQPRVYVVEEVHVDVVPAARGRSVGWRSTR